MSSIRKIAINTGGGDPPGLNAVIRAVAFDPRWPGWKFLRIRYGYRGLNEDEPSLLVEFDGDPSGVSPTSGVHPRQHESGGSFSLPGTEKGFPPQGHVRHLLAGERICI